MTASTIHKQLIIACCLFAAGLMLASASGKPDVWGFFGHRRINRLAVFILPPELIVFYKKHIEYITEHAVDPDKRRYATKYEAIRHYIDVDHWGNFPFPEVPRNWTDALIKYTDIYMIDDQGDTIKLPVQQWLSLPESFADGQRFYGSSLTEFDRNYRDFFYHNIVTRFYEDHWSLDCDSLQILFEGKDIPSNCITAFAVEGFTEYGILPYHLQAMQRQLTNAFSERDVIRILRLSADFGHYIADACVPLHTTENYNGQLTDQIGIHAFWESRIPELLADAYFDYFVGKAVYIDNPSDYFWNIVLESNAQVDSVLLIEKRLSESLPADRQYCFDERLGRTIRTQCPEYVKAYDEAMKGMVEKQMQRAIHAVGSAWYTAWVDAGQPDMRALAQMPDLLPIDQGEGVPADSLPATSGKIREHN